MTFFLNMHNTLKYKHHGDFLNQHSKKKKLPDSWAASEGVNKNWFSKYRGTYSLVALKVTISMVLHSEQHSSSGWQNTHWKRTNRSYHNHWMSLDANNQPAEVSPYGLNRLMRIKLYNYIIDTFHKRFVVWFYMTKIAFISGSASLLKASLSAYLDTLIFWISFTKLVGTL